MFRPVTRQSSGYLYKNTKIRFYTVVVPYVYTNSLMIQQQEPKHVALL